MESQCGVTGSSFVTTPTACSGVTGTVNKIAASTHYSMYLNTDSDVYGVGDVIQIPTLAKHQPKNIGDEDLIFVEIQLGEYFGEDDIVRLEDKYGRI